MDRQQRHDLKHDKFVDEIGALSVRARENQRLLLLIAAAVVGIALLAFGFYFYRSNREQTAQDALAQAIETIESPLIPAPVAGQPPQTPPPNAKFRTEAERSAAAEKQFKDVQDNYSGTAASDIAGLYLGRIAASKGDVATARKNLQTFVDEHKGHLLYGAAQYSLYQIRIDNGEAPQVANELKAEIAKAEPALPGDALLNLLAHAYEVQGNAAEAKATYRRITTEFPESPYVLDAQRRAGPG